MQVSQIRIYLIPNRTESSLMIVSLDYLIPNHDPLYYKSHWVIGDMDFMIWNHVSDLQCIPHFICSQHKKSATRTHFIPNQPYWLAIRDNDQQSRPLKQWRPQAAHAHVWYLYVYFYLFGLQVWHIDKKCTCKCDSQIKNAHAHVFKYELSCRFILPYKLRYSFTIQSLRQVLAHVKARNYTQNSLTCFSKPLT